tara:strand:- start:2017 stop:2766 length:750 start_codon:yes stop_codon:yes gene_type:complete
MGNNKKTVKCSFCNRLGHNRVSCEKLKNEIEKNRQQFGSTHPDVQEFDDYLKDYSKKSRNNANQRRHCSYCLQTGHNIRTCAIKEKDFIKLKRINKEWRNNILNELKSRGIGVGSIMSNKKYVNSMENKKSPWTLVSIDWENLSWIIDNKKVFKLILMSNPAVYRMITLEQLLNESPSYNFRWEVISESDVLDFPHKWDTVSDPAFDSQCIEIFGGLTKSEYDSMFFKLYSDKSHVLEFLKPPIGDYNE